MAITGAHAILYTPEAEAVRDILRDQLGWPHVDAGHGWLIFGMGPSEVGVHPADAPAHELTLTCDDLDATMAELTAKGIEFRGEPEEQGWGRTVLMALPGGLDLMLYQPRHPLAPQP